MYTPKIKILASLVVVATLLGFNSCSSDDEPAPPPEASFTASSQSILKGGSVSFSSTSKNTTELQWLFEGGTPATSTSTSPTVTYNTAGSFSVTLIASNGSSADTETKASHITVVDPVPVAGFTASATEIEPGQTVSFSSTSTNAVSYQWTFEGGTPSSSTEASPTVTYNSEGAFSVTLKAFNSSNVSDEETQEGLINVAYPAPTASFTSSSQLVKTGESVSFTNSSTNAVAYEWTFEGGSPSTSTSVNPTVTYNSAGTYTVSLKAINEGGASVTETKTAHVKVMVPPVAAFNQSSLVIKALESITFTNASSGTDLSYSWTFQGGSPSSSNQANPSSISFETEGSYTVSLTVTNDVGTSTTSKTITVNPPTHFKLVMENNLFITVNIYNNDNFIGSINARTTATFESVPISSQNRIDYEFDPVVVSGKVVGIGYRAGWTLNSPRGEIGLGITNKTTTETLQFHVVDNREAINMYWNVNEGTDHLYTSENLYVPANSVTQLGYTKFVDIDRQMHFYRNQDRSGVYWYMGYGSNVLDDKSGRVDILFDLNGSWETGTWAGSISRNAPREIVVDKKFRADWDIPMQKADFSNATVITALPNVVN